MKNFMFVRIVKNLFSGMNRCTETLMYVTVNGAVRLCIGVMEMSELIEMPYGNEKSLAGEFIKAYTEVQLDVEIDKESEDDVE